MWDAEPGFASNQSTVRLENDENRFILGHFDRFVDEHAEIVCSTSGLRYIFGPEAIDLGPCCDPCDENWTRILKNEDVLKFSQGYSYQIGNEIVRTAKRVIIPETCDNYGNFLGVVLRGRHPSSRDGAMAAFLCPPFGIITLHKFAFGYDSGIVWPLLVGARLWVKLDKNGASVRVWKVEGIADNVEFAYGSVQLPFERPKLHLWQWNNTFNQTGAFAITDCVPRNMDEKNNLNTSELREKKQLRNTSTPTLVDYQDSERKEETSSEPNASVGNAAIELLLEILNDQSIRDLVVERHEQAFENYLSDFLR